MFGKIKFSQVSLIPALMIPLLASGSEPVTVAFLCNSPPGLTPRAYVEGTVTGPLVQDWGNLRSADANVLVQVSGIESDRVTMQGALLGAGQYRDRETGKWIYEPMQAFLEGQTRGGRRVGGGFYFGMGRESYLNLDRTSIRILCDFAPMPPVTGAPVPPSRPTQPSNCHQECRWLNGHDPREFCRTVCRDDRAPRGPRR